MIAVEKWWQHEFGGCRGAAEQEAAGGKLSGWLCGLSRSSNDCRADERSGCPCHGHVSV